jgi:hypothetical protein
MTITKKKYNMATSDRCYMVIKILKSFMILYYKFATQDP